jgi:hypothetical protein
MWFGFGHLPERSNSLSCSVFSSAWIDWLTADCTRLGCRDAAEKLPVSRLLPAHGVGPT